MSYALSTTVERDFTETLDATRAALAEQGFGVLTEIDLSATLKEKIGADVPPQVILGACRPPLAYAAVQAEPSIGLLLPCNVVVYQRDGQTHISAIDADRMLSIVGNEDLAPVAAQVRAKLAAVVERAAGNG